jgi:GTP cyclohydrolase FolE2
MLCEEVGYDLLVGVKVPITTVCPCSKEISVAGAHNQRAWLRVRLRTVPGQFLWLEDIISQLEGFGSCEIYPLVKRPDEKYVTEKGYFNPKFVEDVLRDVVLWLRAHPYFTWFEVECEADESIHLHNAFAYQSEPQPAALNVFQRDLTSADLIPRPASNLPAERPPVTVNGGAHHSSQNGHPLPDVASRHPN